jgi:regulator of PEP synthase PpsR (kinase-PPPase family)
MTLPCAEGSHASRGRRYHRPPERTLNARRIDILSDSTGETAERAVRAAMLQFPHSGAHVQLHTRVRTKEAVLPILEGASKDGALVVFTVVSPELREYIHAASHELKVEALDLIGALIGKLAVTLDRQPINMPTGRLPLTEDYFRRIEAVEFAVRSDDGKEPRNFKRADVVLCGVSRTSKTPLSTLLAQRGLKVANQSVVLGVPLPPELDDTLGVLVVGLTISVDQLVEIRRARLRQLGMPPDASYGLREHVKQELEYAERVFAAHPRWPVIDVSGSAIEETAAIILEALKERDPRSRGSGDTLR